MVRNRLQQLLAQNIGAGGPAGIQARAVANGLEVLIYDVIDPWFGVSAKSVADALRGAGEAPLTVRVNSPGGDVFEGRAIASLIRAHKGPTAVIVDGLAASAASTVALSAQTVTMARGAFLMVHKSFVFTMDNADGLRTFADLLDKIDTQIAADYAAKAGVSAEEAMAWMAAETWFTAEEAVAAKLADAVAETEADLKPFNLAAYDHAPAALMNRLPTPPDRPDYAALRAAADRRVRLYDLIPA